MYIISTMDRDYADLSHVFSSPLLRGHPGRDCQSILFFGRWHTYWLREPGLLVVQQTVTYLGEEVTNPLGGDEGEHERQTEGDVTSRLYHHDSEADGDARDAT